jgi:hypothetical protein
MSGASVSGCASAYLRASVDLPLPGAPLISTRRATRRDLTGSRAGHVDDQSSAGMQPEFGGEGQAEGGDGPSHDPGG